MPEAHRIPISIDVERTFAYRHGFSAGLSKAQAELEQLLGREPIDQAEAPAFKAGLEAALEAVARIPRG